MFKRWNEYRMTMDVELGPAKQTRTKDLVDLRASDSSATKRLASQSPDRRGHSALTLMLPKGLDAGWSQSAGTATLDWHRARGSFRPNGSGEWATRRSAQTGTGTGLERRRDDQRPILTTSPVGAAHSLHIPSGIHIDLTTKSQVSRKLRNYVDEGGLLVEFAIYQFPKHL